MKKKIVEALLAHVIALSIFTGCEKVVENVKEDDNVNNIDIITLRETIRDSLFQVLECRRDSENPENSVLVIRNLTSYESESYVFDFEDLDVGDIIYKVSDTQFIYCGWVE